MSKVISVFGSRIDLAASVTFPAGFGITQWADDVDPFDIPEIVVMETAMGPNGDMVAWSKATAIQHKIAVIADSDDDINLAILLEANRAERGKIVAVDKITLSLTYVSGKRVVFTEGFITAGMPANSGTSAGRYKSKVYTFNFQGLKVSY